MILSGKTIAVIASLGLTAEQARALMTALEEDQTLATAVSVGAAEDAIMRRRAADRARQKAKRERDAALKKERDASADCHVTHSADVTVCHADENVTPSCVSAPTCAQVVITSLPSEELEFTLSQNPSGSSFPAGKRGRKSYDAEFEAFWAIWPKRVEKDGAQKSLRAVLAKMKPPDSFENILRGARRVAAEVAAGKALKYVKNPTTWLNNGCWKDEAIPEEEPFYGTRNDRPIPAIGRRTAKLISLANGVAKNASRDRDERWGLGGEANCYEPDFEGSGAANASGFGRRQG